MDEKKVRDLKIAAEKYIQVDKEKKAEQEKAERAARSLAEDTQRAILVWIDRFNGDKKAHYQDIIDEYEYVNDDESIRRYIDPAVLEELKNYYFEAEKVRNGVAAKKRIETEKRNAKREKAEKRAERMHYVLPILFTFIIVGATAGIAYFVPSIRTWTIAGGAALLSLWTFVMCIGLFGRPFGRVFPIIVHILAIVVSAVCIVIFCAESALVPLLILIGIEAFMLIVFALANASRRFLSVVGILILGAIAAVVALFAYKVIDIDFGKIFGNMNVSGAALNIGVCAVAVLIYAIIWFRLEARYGRNESVVVLASVNAINPFVLIACIVLSAMGGEYAPAGVACGIGALLAYLSCCTVGKEGNNSLVATGMLGVSIVIASASLGLSFFEAGWARGLIIGFPCLISFMPFFIAFFVKIYNRDITHWAPLCFVLTVLGVGLGVMAIVGSVNYPGYMVFLNCASLFYAVLAVVSLFVLGAYDADCAPAAGLAIFIVVFLLVAIPISIVQIVGHVNAYNGTAEILRAAKQFISILK